MQMHVNKSMYKMNKLMSTRKHMLRIAIHQIFYLFAFHTHTIVYSYEIGTII